MSKSIEFSPQVNSFRDNIFTFDQDDQQPDEFQPSQKPQNFSVGIPRKEFRQNISNKNNHEENSQPTQLFTFDQEDQQKIIQNLQNQKHQYQTSDHSNIQTQSTHANKELHHTQDLSDLKSKILFKQQNNLIQKLAPINKVPPFSKPSPSLSSLQVNANSFEEKVNKLKESIKENKVKEAVIKKMKQYNKSLKSKVSQAHSRRNSSNFSICKRNEDEQCQFEAFEQKKPENLQRNKYQIRGAKIVNGEDEPNKQFEYVEQQKAIKVTNLRQFLFTQLAEQYKVNALITRIQDGGFLGKFVHKTKYVVTIEQNNKFLFSVTKDGFNKFIFSMNKDDCSQKNKNYLAQLISKDFSNTQFILYDNGFDPKETKCLEYCFKQMASIKYEETSGPRKFSAIVSTNSKGFHTIQSQVNILEKKWSEKKERKFLSKIYSKEPQFDQNDGNYKLDFKGMAGKPSVKNFVLSSDDFEDCLIFARRNNDTYAMEVKHPFSLVQAVAVCMSSIYHKTIF